MKQVSVRNTLSVFCIVFMLGIMNTALAASEAEDSYRLSDSVVMIYATSKSDNIRAPWSSSTISGSGSGFVLDGGRIITNAHVVEKHTFIEVQRDGDSKRFEAEVIAIAHEVDLAILKLKDPEVFKSIKPLELGDLPEIHQEVTVYGYPVGGQALSITKGIISRIEHQTYVHSYLNFQAIQVDAAINPGNSGGPALVDEKVVGIVMQSRNREDNIGYMIPVTILNRFLADMEDGHYDGFPELSAGFQRLVSPALRKGYNLKEKQSGVLVSKVCFNTPTDKFLKKGDIISSIDGKKIENNGMVMTSQRKRVDFEHFVQLHLVGESVELGLVRDGEAMTVKIPLTKTLESAFIFDQDPRYIIFGGFVLVAKALAAPCLSKEEYLQTKDDLQEDEIVVSQVLASSSNRGFHDSVYTVINKVNGKTFKNFKGFYELLSKDAAPVILLENENGYQIAIDRESAQSEQAELLKKYRIQKAHSAEIDEWKKAPTQKLVLKQ
ncbi:S1C family serine protease [Leucothrix arctica]|uniref:Serine protease n=1 Tax=Leucothrix arctica TaxID=1481894 RepID=A0A317CFZ2_9GAMM|nr:trypsin-like peptidase domain-containing protein [Leucothrix arctica]PWQ96323.1 serine protease [Leucothrix arctica]